MNKLETYFGYVLQANSQMGHFEDGTHKFADPVSNTTLNVWAGVPKSIGP
jgi:hypothetical protein